MSLLSFFPYSVKVGGVVFDVQIAQQLPAAVVNNQVVVLTSRDCSKWTFSYGPPASPESGDIWIHTVDGGGYTLSIAGDQTLIQNPRCPPARGNRLWVLPTQARTFQGFGALVIPAR